MELLIPNNNRDISITTLIGILGILIVCTYNSAFKKGFFTCNKYILNTYLYILMAFVIISLEILLFDRNNIKMDFYNKIGGIGAFILTLFIIIGALILTMVVNPRNVILKHLCWLVLVSMFSFLAYPAYLRSKDNNTLLSVLLSLTAILLVFTAVAFIRPDFISLSWGPVLLFLLIGVILTHVIFLFTLNKRTNQENVKYIRGVSYFIIILFIFFILYDTKKIMIGAKMCIEKKADYINQSLGIVIDALNLFQSLSNVIS